MIDTTTVNYAIAKVSQAWEQAAPQLKNVSTEYVGYVVTKTVIEFPIAIVCLLISIAAFAFLNKKRDDWDDGAVIGMVVVAVVMAAFFGWVVYAGYNVALAVTYPEMYVIHQIIGAAK